MSVFAAENLAIVENPEETPRDQEQEPQMEYHRYYNVNVSFAQLLNANRYFSDDERLDLVLLLGAEKKLVDVFGKEYIHSKLPHQGTGPPPVVRQANWIEWPAEVNEESNVLTITTDHVVYELHLKTQS